MVLDLKQRKKKTFDLVMLDGTQLRIKKANEDFIAEMEGFEKKLRNVKSVKEVFSSVRDMTLKILNRNTDGKVYDALLFNQVDDDGERLYDYDVCMAIFSGYSKFMQEVLRNPN